MRCDVARATEVVNFFHFAKWGNGAIVPRDALSYLFEVISNG